ncbi:MAG: hypothetical protein ACLPUG_03800 [Acidimicrobiales bacterium]
MDTAVDRHARAGVVWRADTVRFRAGTSVAQLATSTGSDFLDALIQLGKSLHLVTIAEGIEMSQLNHVKLQGCHLGQGFLFSRPHRLRTSKGSFSPVTTRRENP